MLKELDAAQAQPTPDQLQRYAALRAAGFEPETVRLAAVQCHRKKKTRFEDVEWMLDQWAERGLFTTGGRPGLRRTMQRRPSRGRAAGGRGLERRRDMDDLALYEEWRKAHDEAVIDHAAACARGTQLPMKFMNKLLADWQAAGVKTVAQAEAQRQAIRARRPAGGASAAANPALDYAQREYKEEDFGDDFFFDVVKEYGEGRRRRHDPFEHIRALLEEYARQRAQDEADMQARTDEAFAKVPEIARLRAESASLALEAMRSILTQQGVEQRAALAQGMKRRGQAINAEIRALLKQNGFPADQLETRYRCPICRDTGYVGEAPGPLLRMLRGAAAAAPVRGRQHGRGGRAELRALRRRRHPGGERPAGAAGQPRELCEDYADPFPDTATATCCSPARAAWARPSC